MVLLKVISKCLLITISFVISIKCQDYCCSSTVPIFNPIPNTGINITHRVRDPNCSIYPGNENCIDIFWTFDENVEIKIHALNLDAQSGDFLMVSSYSLLNQNPPDAENILPVGSDYRIFSWNIEKPVTINVISSSGSFLYFHGEPGIPKDNRTEYRTGFHVQIFPFEKKVPPQTTTTEKWMPTHSSPDEAFVIKVVTGKKPEDFMKEREVFKEKIAEMANIYCDESNIIILEEIRAENIIIPEHEVRYCEKNWPNNDTCVIVKFGIAVLDDKRNYVMVESHINKMWEKHNNLLEQIGLKAYTPPKPQENIVPWIWVGATLGVIIVFSVGLCIVWLRNDDTLNADTRRSERLPEQNTEGILVNQQFYDENNPISHEVKKYANQQKGTSPDIEMTEVPQRRKYLRNGEYDQPPSIMY